MDVLYIIIYFISRRIDFFCDIYEITNYVSTVKHISFIDLYKQNYRCIEIIKKASNKHNNINR